MRVKKTYTIHSHYYEGNGFEMTSEPLAHFKRLRKAKRLQAELSKKLTSYKKFDETSKVDTRETLILIVDKKYNVLDTVGIAK